jgi:hypothetical protein
MIDEQLQAEILEAIEELKRERERAIDEHAEYQLALEGKHPYRAFRGRGAAWNFTIGPAHVWQGPASIEAVNGAKDPVVIFCDYIDMDTLRKVNVTRVRGYVFARGNVIDPAYWWLVDENRASVTCCPEAVAAVRSGETVVVDGVRGVVYLDPDPQTRANYERLRQIGPPRRDKLMWDALKQMCGAIMANYQLRKVDPPYDFDEQDRLVGLAQRARDGETISAEDDAWMQGLLMQGMPSIEEIQERALGKAIDASGKTKPGSDRKKGSGRDRGDRGGGSRRAGKDRAAGGASDDAGDAGDAGATPSAKSGGKTSRASDRRRQRLEEIAAERRRRRGESEPEPEPEPEPNAEPGDTSGDDDGFDPLGDMMG